MTSIVIKNRRNYTVVVNWCDIAYGNGTFVAVSDMGHLSQSASGIFWHTNEHNHVRWSGVTYGEIAGQPLFVAISRRDDVVATSSDGVDWAFHQLPFKFRAKSIGFAALTEQPLFVAVNNRKHCITSPDGFTWTQRPLLEDFSSEVICAGEANGLPVVVTMSNQNAVFSKNGVDWEQSQLPKGVGTVSCFAYGNGRFIGVQEVGNILLHSSDAITWLPGLLPVSATWAHLVFHDGTFYLLATSGRLLILKKGQEDWEVLNLGTVGKRWTSLAVGKLNFSTTILAVGENNRVMTIALQD